MPISVSGNSFYSNDNKIDTSLFVQKIFLRTSYIEANLEEDLDLKNQYRIKNLPNPISIREKASKNYVDNKFSDPSIIEKTLMLILMMKISMMFTLSKLILSPHLKNN